MCLQFMFELMYGLHIYTMAKLFRLFIYIIRYDSQALFLWKHRLSMLSFCHNTTTMLVIRVCCSKYKLWSLKQSFNAKQSVNKCDILYKICDKLKLWLMVFWSTTMSHNQDVCFAHKSVYTLDEWPLVERVGIADGH